MVHAKEKVVCNAQPEQLELMRLWQDAFEGSHKEMALALMNQVLDGKTTIEAALALLDRKHG